MPARSCKCFAARSIDVVHRGGGVVKAARAAGVDVDQVTVDPHTGEITVGARLPANGTTNPLDDWMANRADQTEGH